MVSTGRSSPGHRQSPSVVWIPEESPHRSRQARDGPASRAKPVPQRHTSEDFTLSLQSRFNMGESDGEPRRESPLLPGIKMNIVRLCSIMNLAKPETILYDAAPT